MTTPIIGEGDKLITTVLLSGERLHVRVHPHASGQNVFDAVVKHLELNEITYFGLMIIKDGEQQFLNLEEKLNKLAKYAPHLWKDDGNFNSSLVFTVFFRVKYYVENICLLQEQQTRHQYYLQLRKDVLENSIRVHDDTSMILASYALQTELGDYDRNIHGLDYFVPQHYLPAKTIAKLTIPYIKNALPAMHQSHRGLTEGQAEIEFLKEAQKLSEYGVLFHRVYKKEYNNKVPYNLGICVRGLVVYEESGPVRNPVCKHAWPKVKKMSFRRSKFIVEAESPNQNHAHMMFYTTNYKRSRYLLKISSSFFNFQMMMASRIAMLPEFLQLEEQHFPLPTKSTLPSKRVENTSVRDTVDGATREQATGQQQQQQLNQSYSPAVKEPSRQRPKAEVKQYTLDLMKRDGSFGFSIVGGIELGGIFVKDVTPGGPAATSGQINAGDRIVQINKDSFENVTRREAINTLRNASDKSHFIMESFGQNLIIEADPSIVTPLGVSAQSLALNQPQIPVQQTERESEFIRVDLARRDNSFGIGFTGGPELGGVYVKSLQPHGSAESDGRVAIGDRIVEIDQTNVEQFSRKRIQELLKQSSGVSIIILERYKQLPTAGGLMYIDREKVLRSSQNFTSVTLNKNNDSLGFSITGGLDLGGIFVKYLNPNGPAALDGRLEVGDRLVAVNDISLETASRPKALEIIRTATSPVNLIVEKCVSAGIPAASTENRAVVKLGRSDSIRSLPVKRTPRSMMQPRGMNYSMQHLPNVSANTAHDVNGNYKESNLTPSQRKSMQEVFVVDLTKRNGSFGISLTGGIEVGGIYVKAVQPGGVAEQDGRIMKGDRVVEINARRMNDLSRVDAIEWLKSCEVATFVLERFSQQPLQSQQKQALPQQSASQLSSFDGEFINVELHKRNNTFGLSLLGGPELRGIFIKNLMTGGAAANDGRLRKGDKLIEINGVNLDGLNRYQAVDLLKQAPQTVNLLVEKIHNAQDVPALDIDTFNVELKKGDAGFGLSLTGGAELGGVYVKGILPGGPADSSRFIMKGDRLVELNGIGMDGLTKQQASDLLRKAPPIANLVLERHGAFDNLILPESDFFTVELQRKQSGYGLNLTGGPEIDGVYVKQVQRDSSADQDGRIKKGDRLITINGRNVENATRLKCTEMLKLSQDVAVIHLERCVIGDDLPPLDTVLTVVELTKGALGFGMSLTGGPEIGGIFVKALMPDGSAEKDGRILIGDRVVEMNGVLLDGYTRQQATDLLKTFPTTAVFVLERYKLTSRSLRRNRSTSQQSGHSSSNNSPTMNQQFSFPLYHGAAPSVPPRHVNNGTSSRDIALKRLEEQQRQQQQALKQQEVSSQEVIVLSQSPDSPHSQLPGVPVTPVQHNVHGVQVPVQHNIQGSPVSSRISSLMQQQYSLDKTNVHPPKQHQLNTTSPSKAIHSTHVKPNTLTSNTELVDDSVRLEQETDDSGSSSLTLIEAPIRMMLNSGELQQDSPQRFLKHFSKSANNKSQQSRIPMGPISSVIFGPNRENRNVHELTDPTRSLLESPEIHNTQYSYDVHSSRVHATRDTVVCLQNGRPTVQPLSQTSNIKMNELNDNYVRPQSSQSVYNEHSFSRVLEQPEARDPINSCTGLVKIQPRIQDSFSCATSHAHDDPPVTDLNLIRRKTSSEPVSSIKKSGGLQWVSLNDNSANDVSNTSECKQATLARPPSISPDNNKTDITKPMTSNKLNSSESDSRACLVTSPRESINQPSRSQAALSASNGARGITRVSNFTPSSSGIPVPLASKFNTLPISSSKTLLGGGDYIFEVTLFKGTTGLGMNLSGGGVHSNPVTIKKIASGTAADESGQLRVGDVILEVNGQPVSHLSAKEVISILRSCPSEVQLLTKRPVFEAASQRSNRLPTDYIGL